MSTSVDQILLKMMKSIDIFDSVPDDKLLELAKSFNLGFYQFGHKIIQQWEKPKYIYILKNWELEARKSDWFSSKVLWKILPGEAFGEMSYFRNQTASANVLVTKDSDIREIPVDLFSDFLNNYPKIKEKMIHIMNERDKKNKEYNHFDNQQN